MSAVDVASPRPPWAVLAVVVAGVVAGAIGVVYGIGTIIVGAILIATALWLARGSSFTRWTAHARVLRSSLTRGPTREIPMFELTADTPDNVVAVNAVGDIEDDDYEDVAVPAIEDALSRHDRIRMLLVLGPEFEGFGADAMWEDAKLGAKTFTSYERIALVADASWLRRTVKAFGWLMPGEVRGFALADLATARDWVSG